MLVSGSRIAAVAVLLWSAASAQAADTPPVLDVTASCEAAAHSALSLGRELQSCLADERAAKDQIDHGWAKYSAADKVHCVSNVRSGGPASYVELLSCLDVMTDAKQTSTDAGDATPPTPQLRKELKTK